MILMCRISPPPPPPQGALQIEPETLYIDQRALRVDRCVVLLTCVYRVNLFDVYVFVVVYVQNNSSRER